MSGTGRRAPGPVLRAVVSLGVLGVLAAVLDTGGILSRLRNLRPAWVLPALGVSGLQVAASAWRWRFTAGRLGLRLPFRTALREYYLATFLNQVLPGGVVGDVSRAWRHARAPATPRRRTGTAVRGVVLERASGQAVMAVVAGLSVLALPLPVDSGALLLGAGLALGGCVAAGGAVLLLRRTRSRRRLPVAARRLGREIRAALVADGALPVQLASSGLVVASYLAVYLAAARAMGVETRFAALLPLVAPILVAMLIPVSIAGWGVREGAAAGLWVMAGFPAAEGVAVSVAYGGLVLVSSLPGALVLAWSPARARRAREPGPRCAGPATEGGAALSEDPGRRGRRRPERSGGTPGAVPPAASRPAPG